MMSAPTAQQGSTTAEDRTAETQTDCLRVELHRPFEIANIKYHMPQICHGHLAVFPVCVYSAMQPVLGNH